MFVKPEHHFTDPAVALNLMEAHALSPWVCHVEDGLDVNHVPFWLGRHRDCNARPASA